MTITMTRLGGAVLILTVATASVSAMPLEERDIVAGSGDQSAQNAPRRPTADDGHVVFELALRHDLEPYEQAPRAASPQQGRCVWRHDPDRVRRVSAIMAC